MRHPTLTTACLLLTLGACTGFRAVDTEGAFRAPQPTEDELVRYIERHDIKTVVCLRGEGPESAATARAALYTGARFEQVPMSATRLPPPETLLRLWDLVATATRPLLFHCRAGVDRTGLASALCVLHDCGDLAKARRELDLVPHGHTGLLGTAAMDEVLDRYQPFHGRLAFPDWVRDVYAPELLGK